MNSHHDTHNHICTLQMVRTEALRVHLRGRSEFGARDVTIQGDHCFEVQDGQRMVVSTAAGGELFVSSFALCVRVLKLHPGRLEI